MNCTMEEEIKNNPRLRDFFQELEIEIDQSIKFFSVPPYIPRKKFSSDSGKRIIESEELVYLNQHWGDHIFGDDFSSHRPIIGALLVKIKRKFKNFLTDKILNRYFINQREYNAHLVRFLNKFAAYVDRKDSEGYLDIVNKVDNDVVGINQRVDELIESASLYKLELIRKLEFKVNQLEREIETLKKR